MTPAERAAWDKRMKFANQVADTILANDRAEQAEYVNGVRRKFTACYPDHEAIAADRKRVLNTASKPPRDEREEETGNDDISD